MTPTWTTPLITFDRHSPVHDTSALLSFGHLRNEDVFTEWSGLQANLMGNSEGGVVMPSMRTKLVDSYCGQ